VRFGILVFPGSWSHQDFQHVLADVMGFEAREVWHKATSVTGFDCLILPGGFAHGDYLRAGAIARFSPVMPAVVRFAERGGLVTGREGIEAYRVFLEREGIRCGGEHGA